MTSRTSSNRQIADKVEVDPASTGTITWTRGYLLQKFGS